MKMKYNDTVFSDVVGDCNGDNERLFSRYPSRYNRDNIRENIPMDFTKYPPVR